jgi:hypothetical protein
MFIFALLVFLILGALLLEELPADPWCRGLDRVTSLPDLVVRSQPPEIWVDQMAPARWVHEDQLLVSPADEVLFPELFELPRMSTPAYLVFESEAWTDLPLPHLIRDRVAGQFQSEITMRCVAIQVCSSLQVDAARAAGCDWLVA